MSDTAPSALAVVLCRANREADAIASLAARRGAMVLRLRRPHPGDPRLAPSALPAVVVLVDANMPGVEDALHRAGKRVVVIDHGSSRSALEQVADLLDAGVLGEAERLISADARGGWPELLAAAGGGPAAAERARGVRRDDLATRVPDPAGALDAAKAWLESAMTRGDMAELPVRRTDAGAGRLTLVAAPAVHAPVLLDALYERWLETNAAEPPSEVLTVHTGADGRPVSLALSAGAGRRAIVDAAVAWAAAQGGPVGRLRLSRRSGGCGVVLEAEAGPDAVDGAAGLDALADRLVEELLDGNRPLRRWRAQFLTLLALPDGVTNGGGGAAAEPAPAAERAYWLPHLRPLLAPADPANAPAGALTTWRIDGRCGVGSLALRVRRGDQAVLTLPLAALRLHRGPAGLCAVEWSVEGGIAAAESGTGWRAMLALGAAVARQPADQPATVAELLDALDLVRPLYSPYAGDHGRREVDLLHKGTPVGTLKYGAAVPDDPAVPTGWFAALAELALAPLGVKAADTRLLQDERARVVAAVVPAGEGPALAPGLAAGRVIATRLSGVDPYGPGHAYDPAFAEAELARAAYDRFAGFGTRYLVSDHSLCLLGYGWFPAHVAADHLATLYRRLFLVALWRAAVAQRLRAAAAELVAGNGGVAARDRLSALRRAAVAFRAGFGGGPVTSQMQGKELFALMQEHTQADADLDAALALAAEVLAEITAPS